MVIPLHTLETIDSTSTYASELLKQGHKAPFAVWARAQTHGRGRHGHSWDSPLGNLYLTVVLAPLSREDLSKAPLWVAAMVCLKIEQRTGLKLAIKWPNDLMYDNKKIGGILCESSSEGVQLGPILIGIGLNVLSCDSTFSKDYAYEPTCLHSSLSSDSGPFPPTPSLNLDVQNFVIDFLESFETQWKSRDWDLEFTQYHLPDGQIWQDKITGDLFCQKGLTALGELRLSNLKTGESEIVQSSQNPYRWIGIIDDAL
jgi:biotin-[acetyl-CoA-carboxylase] ligase BirA-like protein